MSTVTITALRNRIQGNTREVKALLERIGIHVDIKDASANCIEIKLDYDLYASMNACTRNAGRKTKDAFRALTFEDYRKRRDRGQTMDEIAEYVGLSRSTLYRRVKAAEELHLFWVVQ